MEMDDGNGGDSENEQANYVTVQVDSDKNKAVYSLQYVIEKLKGGLAFFNGDKFWPANVDNR